jgi:cell division protein FtsB
MDYDKLPPWGQVLVVLVVATVQGIAVLAARKWKSWHVGDQQHESTQQEKQELEAIREKAAALERLIHEGKLRDGIEQMIVAHRDEARVEFQAYQKEIRAGLTQIEARLVELDRAVAILETRQRRPTR